MPFSSNDPPNEQVNLSEFRGTTSQNDWRFEKWIESDPDNCAKIIGPLVGQLERLEWSSRDVFAIHMAMEEGILNAIRHGNRCAADKKVYILIRVSADRFYAQIIDQGEGFRLEDVPDPTLEENLENTSGRGVMLIHTFMDTVIYNEKGNGVEFHKRKNTSLGVLE